MKLFTARILTVYSLIVYHKKTSCNTGKISIPRAPLISIVGAPNALLFGTIQSLASLTPLADRVNKRFG